jgi:hypothetical protein
MTRPLAWLVPVLPFAMLTSALDAGAQTLEPPPPVPPGYPSQPAQPLPGSASSPPPVNPPSSDESEDSGLGLEWVWLNAEAGASYVDMQSFSSSTFGLQKTSSSGPTFGVGAGVRLLFFTLGARARDLSLSSIGNLWMLNLEAALHTRIWRFDPYLGVRGGYNFVGSLSSSSVQVATGNSPPEVSVHGFNVGPMVGLDFYPLNFLSIGADVDAQFLFLQRPPPPLPYGVTIDDLPPQYQPYKALYQESGSSAGFAFTAAAHIGLHY